MRAARKDQGGERTGDDREAGFDIDSIDGDPSQREYAVMRHVLATVKRMRPRERLGTRSGRPFATGASSPIGR
jgi:hypothetical protein